MMKGIKFKFFLFVILLFFVGLIPNVEAATCNSPSRSGSDKGEECTVSFTRPYTNSSLTYCSTSKTSYSVCTQGGRGGQNCQDKSGDITDVKYYSGNVAYLSPSVDYCGSCDSGGKCGSCPLACGSPQWSCSANSCTPSTCGQTIDNGCGTNITCGACPPTVSCSPNKTSAQVGDQVTWTATGSGGSGSYYYLWSDVSNVVSNQGWWVNQESRTYTTPGIKSMSVQVVDGNNLSSAWTTCSANTAVSPIPPVVTTLGGFLSCNANSYTFNWGAVSGASYYGAHILDDTVRPVGAADCAYGTDICVGDATIGTSYTLPSTSQSSSCGILAVGAALTPGQTLSSCNGVFRLTLQTDGNAVVYNSSNAALWSSNTSGKASAKIIMQGDGNLVIYNASNGFIWGSVNGNGGKTGTPSGLNMQGDGNLVVYSTSGGVLWASNTGGRTGTTLQIGHTYEARSYAYNGSWSNGSNTIKFTVPNASQCIPVSIPTGLNAVVGNSSCGAPTNLSWDATSNAVGYYIYRSSDGTNYSQIASTTLTSYSDSSVSINPGTYYYKIAAYNAAGASGQTSSKSIDNSSGCSCPNGAVNYPSCTTCAAGQSFVGGSCAFQSVSPVGISSFSVIPNTISKGSNCNLSWVITPTDPDANSICSLYRGNTLINTFSPGVSGIYKDPTGISNETIYKLSCGEMVGGSPSNITNIKVSHATCYINPNYNETK